MTEMLVMPLEMRRSTEGNAIEGICVPYGRTTLKAGNPRGERFLPGAFGELDAQRAKVRLTDSHADSDSRRPVGVATAFRDTLDGLYGAFRFYDTPEGRGARENVLEDTYGGLSVGFIPIEERIAADGAREIVRARLFHVSLVDEPAYEEAKILSVRSAMPDITELLAVRYDIADMPVAPDLARLVYPLTGERQRA